MLQVTRVENGWLVHMQTDEDVTLLVFSDPEELKRYLEEWADQSCISTSH